jgi:hypothetical protein
MLNTTVSALWVAAVSFAMLAPLHGQTLERKLHGLVDVHSYPDRQKKDLTTVEGPLSASGSVGSTRFSGQASVTSTYGYLSVKASGKAASDGTGGSYTTGYWNDVMTVSAPGRTGGATIYVKLGFSGSVQQDDNRPTWRDMYSSRVEYLIQNHTGTGSGGATIAEDVNDFTYGDYLDVPLGGTREHAFNIEFGVPFALQIFGLASTSQAFGSEGSATMTIIWKGMRVVPHSGDAVQQFSVTSESTVNYADEIAPPGISFSDWAELRGLSGPNAAWDADVDKDGHSNFLEYAFGMDPSNGNGSPVTAGSVTVGGQRYLSLTFSRPTGESKAYEVAYTGQSATTLLDDAAWAAENVVVHSTESEPEHDRETVTLRSVSPMATHSREFLRLRISSNATPPAP